MTTVSHEFPVLSVPGTLSSHITASLTHPADVIIPTCLTKRYKEFKSANTAGLRSFKPSEPFFIITEFSGCGLTVGPKFSLPEGLTST